jgi:hypothetical protein
MINTLRAYDVNTDPSAVAAVNSIKASYDILITQMQQKNAMVVGNLNTSAARGGAMQYASTMYDAANSQAVQAGIMRINDLQAKEADAIQKSNDAYASGNVKALDQATTDLKNAQAEARQTLQDVATTINNQVKDNLAQAKQDAADAKQQNTLDISTSKSIAQATLDAIKSSGITDATQIQSAIKEIADANGISNPSILQGQIATLDPQYGTAALKNQNLQARTNKITNPPPKTVKPKVDGGFTYTQADVSKYMSFLNTGGTASDGTVYGGKGSTYVNTGTYIAAYNDWTSPSNGGTPQGFVKNFPVTSYVNPKDYKSLPANIVPKTTTTTVTTTPGITQ